MKLKYILLGLITVSLFSCKPEMKDGFEPSNGSADFSKYVALGNSLTAGYADGALYHSAQQTSYVSLIADKLKEIGGGDFIQPVVNSERGVLPGKLQLAVINDNLAPVPVTEGELEGFYPPIGYSVDNLGVPGAKVGHLLAPGYGNMENLAAGLANPYFIRFASSPDISVIEQALALHPTFFSLWIGNNDVLGYAANGGVGVITPSSDFETYYNGLTHYLQSSGAKGVLASIPSVSGTAFFNTVPANALVIDAPTAALLNGGIALVEDKVNAILAAIGQTYSYHIHFEAGANGFLIEDNNFPYKDLFNAIADTSTDIATKIFLHQAQFRQINVEAGELLTLKTPQDSLAIGMGSFLEIMPGVKVPFGIPNKYVLDVDELANIDAAIDNFNTIIKNIAEQYDWAYADINKEFDEAKDGVIIDGIEISAKYVSGGIFSLDGIHLTPRGNAVVANYFIKAINKKYASNISTINISSYPGVHFPND